MRSGRSGEQPLGAITKTLTAEQVWAACELVAESIPHIVWLSHPSGSTDYFNTLGTDYTGLPREATYGWRWLELVHPDDAERAGLGWESATRTLTPFELTYRIRRSDGQFRWHAFRALPIRRPNGEILRWIGTADDVDDGALPEDNRARIERQTRELLALLEAAQPAPEDRFGFVPADRRWRRVRADLDGAPSLRRELAGDLAAGSAVDRLGPREIIVLRLIAGGHTSAEIANLLGLSQRSIETSRYRLRQTLGVTSRAELVRFAHEAGVAGPQA
jgi:PAS domain S-box-containing protein